MNTSRVSIIMPAFNATKHLGTAVESVLSQSYQNWELLIVDDGSNDGTLELIEKMALQDERIHVFHNNANAGIAASRNLALGAATGRYIAFLDSDDMWLPGKLDRQVAFMQENNVSICFSGYHRIDESGVTIGSVSPPPVISYKMLLRSNFIGNLTGIYDCQTLGKQTFGKLKHEDYVAWLALIKKAKIAQSIIEPLAAYRVRSNSTSANKLATMRWQWLIYRQSEGLSFLHASLLMISYTYYALYKRL